MYRERVHDKLIVKIDKEKGKLIIHEGRYETVFTMMDCLEPFPEALRDIPQMKMSVLVHWVCDETVAWMQENVKYMLAGEEKA